MILHTQGFGFWPQVEEVIASGLGKTFTKEIPRVIALNNAVFIFHQTFFRDNR